MSWERQYRSFVVTRWKPYAFGITRRSRNRGYIYQVGVRDFSSWREAKAWIDEFWENVREQGQ